MQPVEIEATSLTPEEWFFLHQLYGKVPGARPEHVKAMHESLAGLTTQQAETKFLLGREAFRARGAIVDRVQPDGSVGFQFIGRIITRLTRVDPKQILKG